MLVKLSGDKYIESTAIAMIEPMKFMSPDSIWKWRVAYIGNPVVDSLTQQQFNELMDCLPTPIESDKKLQTQLESKELRCPNCDAIVKIAKFQRPA